MQYLALGLGCMLALALFVCSLVAFTVCLYRKKPPKPYKIGFRVGETVDGLYLNGDWYKAIIEETRDDGTYMVAWTDGDPFDKVKWPDQLRRETRPLAEANVNLGNAMASNSWLLRS